ncbi:hypothetical protein WA538_005198 [Blastocystis sp. DL]
MGKEGGDRAVYDEDERRKFLLGFHNRKKERKIEYLTKKALKAKQERVLEKIARKRNLLKRERELGLLDDEDGKRGKVMSQENIDDTFSKNMFGTEEVTVTVEYDGNGSEEEKKEEEKEEVKAEAPKEEEDEDKLNEEEERILENVKLTENELRRIREEANKKPKHKKRKKHRKGRH